MARRLAIPSTVRVSYQMIHIKVGPCEDLGWYDAEFHEIVIREGQTLPEEANTLLHEILHAVFHCYNLDKRSNEEKIVGGFANGMTEVMTNNPTILRYFARAWSGTYK